jgi:hypothetical protein
MADGWDVNSATIYVIFKMWLSRSIRAARIGKYHMEVPMKRHSVFFVLLLCLIGSLPACATPLMYSAKEIRGQIVDAETGQAVEGAVIVAQWVLSHIGSGGYGARIHIYETVTDKGGNYTIPAWGPVPHPPLTDLIFRDPEILIFKGGYEPEGLENRVPQTDSVRVSEWDGKVVKLARTKRGLEDQAFRLSSFYGGLDHGSSTKDWYSYPRMLLALDAERGRLRSLGLKPGHSGSIPNLENFSDADRVYLKRFEK